MASNSVTKVSTNAVESVIKNERTSISTIWDWNWVKPNTRFLKKGVSSESWSEGNLLISCVNILILVGFGSTVATYWVKFMSLPESIKGGKMSSNFVVPL